MELLLVNMEAFTRVVWVQPVEQTGNRYHYNQAVGEVQPNQLHSVKASIAKDYQQSPQVSRIENPLFNEYITSALLAQQLPPFQSLVEEK